MQDYKIIRCYTFIIDTVQLTGVIDNVRICTLSDIKTWSRYIFYLFMIMKSAFIIFVWFSFSSMCLKVSSEIQNYRKSSSPFLSDSVLKSFLLLEIYGRCPVLKWYFLNLDVCTEYFLLFHGDNIICYSRKFIYICI